MSKYRFVFLPLGFMLILGFLTNHLQETGRQKVIGVKIYKHEGSSDSLFSKWERAGINTVFASPGLLNDEQFKKLAAEKEISTYVIVPIFYAPDELAQDSTLYAVTQQGNNAEEEWVKFACPNAENIINNRIKFIINFIKEHNPTGLSIDFIRHFVFWEKVYPGTDLESLPNTCFCRKCLNSFSAEYSLQLPDKNSSENDIYNWIQKHCFDQWIQWKCSLITNLVRRIVREAKAVKPELKINLHALPWRQNDFGGAIKTIAGQDFKSLAKYVDYLSPMTYSHMVKREPSWISSVVHDISTIAGAKILPSIQVSRAYLPEAVSLNEFEKCCTEAVKKPSAGVIFWNWAALEKDVRKFEIVCKKFGNKSK